jgi:hypothetical protein
MSIFGEIRATMDAMGVEQQACMFAFLVSYPLSLGRLLEPRGRGIAAAASAVSAIAFAVLTDPWMHAVLFVAMLIVTAGGFIAAAYALDGLARRIVMRGVPAMRPVAVSDAPATVLTSGRTKMPIGATAVAKP